MQQSMVFISASPLDIQSQRTTRSPATAQSYVQQMYDYDPHTYVVVGQSILLQHDHGLGRVDPDTMCLCLIGCLSVNHSHYWRLTDVTETALNNKLQGCIVLNEHNTVFARSGLLYATTSCVILTHWPHYVTGST